MTKQCRQCVKDFKVKPSHYDLKVYCSRACMSEGYRERMSGNGNPNFREASIRQCCICNAEYQSYSKTTKYCSLRCRSLSPANIEKCRTICYRPKPHRVKKGRSPKTPTCVTCARTFESKCPRKYCTSCSPYARYTRFIKQCIVCGKSKSDDNKTCSDECRTQWRAISQRGAKSHRWRGGITPKARTIRNSLEYKIWRQAVFSRDDYACQLCDTHGGRLAAHHIKPFSTYEHLRTVISNGITLCWPCHRFIKGREHTYEAAFTEAVEKVIQIAMARQPTGSAA